MRETINKLRIKRDEWERYIKIYGPKVEIRGGYIDQQSILNDLDEVIRKFEVIEKRITDHIVIKDVAEQYADNIRICKIRTAILGVKRSHYVSLHEPYIDDEEYGELIDSELKESIVSDILDVDEEET